MEHLSATYRCLLLHPMVIVVLWNSNCVKMPAAATKSDMPSMQSIPFSRQRLGTLNHVLQNQLFPTYIYYKVVDLSIT